MAKANQANYKAVEDFLADKGYEYVKLNEYHYRIMGPVAVADLWPGRMTINVVQTEGVFPAPYFKLSYWFKPKELDNILNGKAWNE